CATPSCGSRSRASQTVPATAGRRRASSGRSGRWTWPSERSGRTPLMNPPRARIAVGPRTTLLAALLVAVGCRSGGGGASGGGGTRGSGGSGSGGGGSGGGGGGGGGAGGRGGGGGRGPAAGGPGP